MKVKMRIYKTHDLDLMYYYLNFKSAQKECGIKNPTSFTGFIKDILRDYANNTHNTKILVVSEFTEKLLPTSIEVNFKINDEKDKAIIDLLNNIKPRQKNSFLKNLIRRYLSEDDMSCYLINKRERKKTEIIETFNKKQDTKTINNNAIFEKKEKKNNYENNTKINMVIESPIMEVIEENESSNDFDFFKQIGNMIDG